MSKIETFIGAIALSFLLSWQWDMPPESQALQDVAAAAEQYPVFYVEYTK